MTADRQRLDKWLFFTRLMKSRTLASRLVEDGHVRVNAVRVVDPARTLKAGDVLTVALERSVRVVRVEGFGDRRGPFEEARLLYADLADPEGASLRATRKVSSTPGQEHD